MKNRLINFARSRSAALLPAAILTAAPAFAQLRVVSYNTLSGPANTTEADLARTIFDAIATTDRNGITKRPDIIGLQEQVSGSPSTAQRLADALNTEFGVSSYQTILLSNGIFKLAYVYDSATVTARSSSEVAIGTRPALRTEWRPVGGYNSTADFYTYNVHYKAGSSFGDFVDRANESTALRGDADALGDGTPIIYMGDFNISTHLETAYTNLTAAGNGQAFDPVGLTSWPGSAVGVREYLTQSTRSGSLPDGGASGGLDDRFDLQLVTDELLDGEGLSYIGPTTTGLSGTEHSYNVTGNDGVVYNTSINSTYVGRDQSAATLDALYSLSDHLPVVADYQLPASMQVTPDALAPLIYLKGSTLEVDFTVENNAPVAVVLGADELDYTYSTSGSASGSGSGSDAALGGGNEHTISLGTSAAGLISGTLSVNATSEGAANASQTALFNYIVANASNGSFDDAGNQDTLNLDLGDFVLNGQLTPGDTFSIYNRQFLSEFTAAMDLDTITETDADNKFTLSGPATFSDLAADGSQQYTVDALVDAIGSFSASYDFDLSDQDLVFNGTTEQITLNVSFDVVGVLGDLNGDASVTNQDIAAFVMALTDPTAYATNFPTLDPDLFGDFNGDGLLDTDDIDGFVAELTGGSQLAAEIHQAVAAVPEPSSALALLGAGSLLAGRRRRRAAIA